VQYVKLNTFLTQHLGWAAHAHRQNKYSRRQWWQYYTKQGEIFVFSSRRISCLASKF